jgi:tRNA(adenine34) deaminase
MRRALQLAECAQAAGEVPVGAIVVLAGSIIAEGWNQPIGAQDPTAHAEIVALRAAGKAAGNYRLGGATLFVTLEPCAMCLGAMLNARISRVVFGAWDAKAGACGSVIDLPRQMRAVTDIDAFGGVCADASRDMLRSFFSARR